MATVPISDTTTRNDYTATASQTTFPYTFWIKEADHLDVYVNGTLQTLTTDYTVSAVQNTSGANVVFNSGLSEDDAVAIVYNPDIERASEFQVGGSFRAAAINLELTYLLSLMQWFKTQLTRTLSLSDSSTASSTGVGSPEDNAGKFIRAKLDGTGFDYTDIASDASSVGSYEQETFDGDNSTTDFVLTTFTPAAQNALLIHVGTTLQIPGVDFTVSGATVSFTSAPASGTDNIIIRNLAASTNVTTPSDGVVTTAKIAGGAVTTAKIADDAITSDKVNDAFLATITNPALLDEDDMSSDSDTQGATQQSIKAYVDNNVYSPTLETAVTLTNQTEVDFTSIPSGVNKIYIYGYDFSTNGTSDIILQLGDSGGFETTGYVGNVSDDGGASTAYTTNGFYLIEGVSAANVYQMVYTLHRVNGNTWMIEGGFARTSSTFTGETIGRKTLSAEVNSARITTVSGTQQFDAGVFNIGYE